MPGPARPVGIGELFAQLLPAYYIPITMYNESSSVRFLFFAPSGCCRPVYDRFAYKQTSIFLNKKPLFMYVFSF